MVGDLALTSTFFVSRSKIAASVNVPPVSIPSPRFSSLTFPVLVMFKEVITFTPYQHVQYKTCRYLAPIAPFTKGRSRNGFLLSA